jgi:hypothetical protein
MKTIKALLGLAVLVTGIYLGWNLIPPYFNDYKLEGAIADEARINTYSNKSEDAMRETVVQKAKDFDIALNSDNVTVTRGNGTVAIDVKYTIHLDFPVHPVDLNFHTESKNHSY